MTTVLVTYDVTISPQYVHWRDIFEICRVNKQRGVAYVSHREPFKILPEIQVSGEMIEVILTFLIAFLFSFIGTIPPGTLSVSIIQLGLNERIAAAWRMALAASVIEYPYAWIAVEFEDFIKQSVALTHNFHLLAAIAMILLGWLNLWSASRPTKFTQRFEASGFRKGVILSLLNPLAIPFWIAMTAYLKTYGWIDLSNSVETHAYLLGVSTGTLVLFMLLAYLAKKVVSHFRSNSFFKRVPGWLLIAIGLYSLLAYILG